MNKKITKQDIDHHAHGRWQWVLEQVGIPRHLLNKKHHPCPRCGGEDRFRFTDYNGTGTWLCNQCETDGASPYDLIMEIFGCQFTDALHMCARALGLETGDGGKFVAKNLPEPNYKDKNGHLKPIVPVPAHALESMTFVFGKNWQPAAKHIYRNSKGEIVGGVARFIKQDGKKLDLPYTYCLDEETGEYGWHWRGWVNPRPLYGLENVVRQPEKTVLVVEGEKCKAAVDAANLGVVALTWHGGTNNWDNADWSEVVNRKVILWADADSKREKLTKEETAKGIDPESKPYLPKYEQGGMKAMLGVADLLVKQGCDVCFVDLPDVAVLPDGYDVADALAEGSQALLPVHEILSWQGAADWLVDYDTLLARIKVSAPSKSKRSAPALPVAVADDGCNADAQDDGVSAGQGKGAADNLLKTLLENYALIGMKERAINLQTGETLSRRQLIKVFGDDAVLNWQYSRNVKKLPEFEAEMLSKKLILQAKAQNADFAQVLKRYVYLDGTTDAFDIKLNSVVSLAAVKAAIPDEFDDWAKSPLRYVCPIQNYVFEPALPAGISFYDREDGTENVEYINNFNGFDIHFERVEPMPKETTLDYMWQSFSGCREILGLIWHLCACNGEKETSLRVFEWILNWIACRLRFPHIKPATALVFISEVQGVGKSTFGERIIKGLFTQYCRQLDQNALESRFNASLLFALITIFEEISPSDERMNIIGKLKNMITSDVIMVERKGRDAEKFADYNSFMIFSNDPKSIPIETNDRRFMVSECKVKYSDEQYERLDAELKNGGLEVFAEFLFALPLMYTDDEGNRREFTPHSKPLITPIKKRMIALNKSSWEAFFDDLKNGEIKGLPFVTMHSKDLWAVYLWWCDYTRTFKMTQKNFFNAISSKFERDYRTPCDLRYGTKPLRIFVVPHAMLDEKVHPRPTTGSASREGKDERRITTAAYYGKQVEMFHDAAAAFLTSLPDLQ